MGWREEGGGGTGGGGGGGGEVQERRRVPLSGTVTYCHTCDQEYVRMSFLDVGQNLSYLRDRGKYTTVFIRR